MATTARLLTYDDLCRMPNDGQRYELIGGAIVVTASPTRMHQALIGRVFRLLDDHASAHDLGWVYVAPLDIHLGPYDVVQPDVVFIRRARKHVLIDNGTTGAPDLVVEILSPSTRSRDLGEKLDLYARAGVKEYWVIDPDDRSLQLYAPQGDKYVLVPQNGPVVRSLCLPRLEIDVTRLFRGLP